MISKAMWFISMVPQGPVGSYNVLWLMVVPMFWDEYLKGIPFLFICEKEDWNLVFGMPKGRYICFKGCVVLLFL